MKDHYTNNLRSDVSKHDWTLQEDMKLVDLINQNGRDWKTISSVFPNRTQNQVKNRFFGRIQKLHLKKIAEEAQLP